LTLVDTDVLVWYLRGNARAAHAIETNGPIALSVVTYAELVQGMRSKAELAMLRGALAELEGRIVQINESISAKAMFYVEQRFHSHAVELPDALIAATAVGLGAPLLTANVRHFRPLADVEVRAFRPAGD